jgi:sugar lactone lactonase YvrE
VLFDADAGIYLVSNINGSPGGKDDNGFISQVDPNGTVIALKWIDGSKKDVSLNAPKGMAIAHDLLYVADIDFVRIFDAKTGAPKGKVGIPQATFLNDVAAGPDGSVYVTDSGLKVTAKGFEPSGTDAVYKIDAKGKVETVIKGATLNRPNGIFVDDTGIWVVTFGAKELFRVANGEKTSSVELPAGSLDGLVRLPDGAVLVSSWDSSSVYYGKDGKFTPLVTDAKSPADIGYDAQRNSVLIPLFTENAVLLQPVKISIAPTPTAAASDAKPSAK